MNTLEEAQALKASVEFEEPTKLEKIEGQELFLLSQSSLQRLVHTGIKPKHLSFRSQPE